MNPTPQYDVVIVGAGVAGALIAKQLGAAGKKVLILEAGAGLPNDNANGTFMERFFLAQAKVPESPYVPPIVDTAPTTGYQAPSDPSLQNAGRPSTLTLTATNWNDKNAAYLDQQGPLAFSSTYERIAAGTMRHWLGTSLRFVPNDFQTKTVYGVMEDWPITYDQLEPWYGKAEYEIGIAADTADQAYLGIQFENGYHYPMPPIPASLVDQAVNVAIPNAPQVDGIAMLVANTPAGRNSRPYQGRRVCAGNTNCIPVCPIQAKYDPSVTLAGALQTGNVTIQYQSVVNDVVVGSDGKVTSVSYLRYTDPNSNKNVTTGSATGTVFVLAAHAIETPKLLLMSTNQGRTPSGVANSSGHVGQHLMDHPLYLSWALAKNPVYGYRGPLSTSGIENLRDGPFRSSRAAFRIEIGNEGWNFAVGDPNTTTLDFINGSNNGGLNGRFQTFGGKDLVARLNHALTRQFRLGFLMEQTPDDNCTVSLSDTWTDNLGIKRPKITYAFSDYTKMGFVAARKTASAIYKTMGADEYTVMPTPTDPPDPTVFEVTYDTQGNVCAPSAPGATTENFRFFGAGHTVGTYRMGSDRSNSVVDANQRSWDHANLFLVGSGVFPTVATANPTLTIAALSLWAAQTILHDLR